MKGMKYHRLLPHEAQDLLRMAAVADSLRRSDPMLDARYRFTYGSTVDQTIRRLRNRWPAYFRECQ